jgi:predicted ATP-grasp superfamily ATP-dependent carboligase
MRVALICNNVELSKAVLASLNANGIRPLMLANDQCHSLFRASRFVDRLWKAGEEFTEAEQVAAVLKDCHVDFGIDQLLADNVVGLRVIDDIRREIKIPVFPMPARRSLEMLDNKATFEALVSQIPIPVPPSRVFPSIQLIDADGMAQKIGFPLVIKPASSFASIGLKLVENEAELEKARSDRSYVFSPVIVQKFINGRDAGVSIFAKDGAVSAVSTFMCGPKNATDFVDIPALAEMAEKIARATSYNGIANFDARIDETGRIWVLECNPRFFMRLTATRLCGLDFLRLGLPGRSPPKPPRATGCYFSPTVLCQREPLRRLIQGEWSIWVLAQSLRDVLRDPGIHAMRGVEILKQYLPQRGFFLRPQPIDKHPYPRWKNVLKPLRRVLPWPASSKNRAAAIAAIHPTDRICGAQETRKSSTVEPFRAGGVATAG